MSTVGGPATPTGGGQEETMPELETLLPFGGAMVDEARCVALLLDVVETVTGTRPTLDVQVAFLGRAQPASVEWTVRHDITECSQATLYEAAAELVEVLSKHWSVRTLPQ